MPQRVKDAKVEFYNAGTGGVPRHLIDGPAESEALPDDPSESAYDLAMEPDFD